MHEDLLRAVLAAPDDPAPRLVYADALMRAGDPRGEFVALQCSPAPEAEARARELLDNHTAEWLAALPHVTRAIFDRGFASAAWIALNHPDPAPAFAALEREPITFVAPVIDEAHDGDFELAPKASWLISDGRKDLIRALDLTELAWEEEAMQLLLGAAWPALRDLHIGDVDCTASTLHAIVAGRYALTTLGLHGHYYADLGDDIGILVNAETATSLRRLAIDNCKLTDPGAEAIASSPFLAKLQRLSCNANGYESFHLSDDGALALAHSPHLRALTHLSLVGSRVGDEFVDTLADGNVLPALTSLSANRCIRVTSDSIIPFAFSTRFSTITELAVGGCTIDDDGVAALARSPNAHSLRTLDLHGDPLTVDAARHLADSPLATQLQKLVVSLTPETEAILRPAFGDRLNRG